MDIIQAVITLIIRVGIKVADTGKTKALINSPRVKIPLLNRISLQSTNLVDIKVPTLTLIITDILNTIIQDNITQDSLKGNIKDLTVRAIQNIIPNLKKALVNSLLKSLIRDKKIQLKLMNNRLHHRLQKSQ